MRPILLCPVAALLAVAATVAAAEPQQPPKVHVGDFALDPMGNWTVDNGRVVLHPKAELGAGYDSNVYAAKEETKSDGYLTGLAGLEVRYAIGDSQKLTADAEAQGRRWFQESQQNMVLGRGRLTWEHDNNAGLRSRATAGYSRVDDPDIQTGVRIQRGEADAAARTTWQGRLARVSGGLAYNDERYFSDGEDFDRSERQNHRLLGEASAGMRYAANAEAYVHLVGDTWRYPDGGNRFRDSNGAQVLGGWRIVPSSRTEVLAEAGVEVRHYSGYYLDDPAYDDKSTVTPAANFKAGWSWEEGSAVVLNGYSHMVGATTANGSLLLGGDASLHYRLRTKAALLARVAVKRLTDTGAAAGEEREVRTTENLDAGGEYLLREGVGMRLVAGYEHSTAVVGEDYNRWTLSFVTAIAY